VEEIAHGVDKDHLRFFPAQRNFQGLRMQGQLEPVGVVGLAHGMQTLRHTLGIAMLAARADLGAARQGIPGGFGPLDARFGSHRLSPPPNI